MGNDILEQSLPEGIKIQNIPSTINTIVMDDLTFDDIFEFLVSSNDESDRGLLEKIIRDKLIYPNKLLFDINDLDDESIIYVAYHYYDHSLFYSQSSDLGVLKKNYDDINSIIDMKKAYIEFFAAATAYMIKFHFEIRKVTYGILQIGDYFLSRFPDYTNSELQQKMSDKIEKLYQTTMVFQRANEYLMNKDIDIAKLIYILHQKKWFITQSIDMETVNRIIENESDIDRIITDYFLGNEGQRLKIMVERWMAVKSIKLREMIIKTCLNLAIDIKSNESFCYVIIPSMIAQIDGLLSVLAEKLGLTFDNSAKRPHWKDESGKEQKRDKSIQVRNKHHNFIDPIEPANGMLFELLFQKAYYGQPLVIPTTLNRHKIMHGEELEYGTIDNVIRVFLIIDFLSTVL